MSHILVAVRSLSIFLPRLQQRQHRLNGKGRSGRRRMESKYDHNRYPFLQCTVLTLIYGVGSRLFRATAIPVCFWVR